MNPLNRLLNEISKLNVEKQNPSSSRIISAFGEKISSDFSSYDYLNLCNHPKVVRSYIQSIENYKLARNSGRLNSAHLHLLERAEKHLAQFLNAEAALLFTSRNQALISAIASLLNDSDTLFCSDRVETPFHDLSLLQDYICTHNLVSDRSKITAYAYESLRCDPSGQEIMASSLSTLTFLDETYSLQLRGLTGAGLHQELSLQSPNLVMYGDLSIHFPISAGFLAGPRELINFIKLNSRSLQFDAHPAPANLNALMESLDLCVGLSSERALLKNKLLFVSNQLKGSLENISLTPGVLPLVEFSLSNQAQFNELKLALIENDIFPACYSYKSHSKSYHLIRIILNSWHQDADISRLLNTLVDIDKKFNVPRGT